jgi:Streptomyces sporulation and cell division protein, SsgA
MTDCINHLLHMELLLTPEHPVAVPTRLSYWRQDPFAVRVTFHTDTHDPVVWVFARDLLAHGTHAPSGEGDVRVRPSGRGPDAMLHLFLTSPHGHAHLRASLPALAEWLKLTYLLVPAGREGDELDLDLEVSRLLYGAA